MSAVQGNALQDLAVHLELDRSPPRHGSVERTGNQGQGPPAPNDLGPRHLDQDRRIIGLVIGIGLGVARGSRHQSGTNRLAPRRASR